MNLKSIFLVISLMVLSTESCKYKAYVSIDLTLRNIAKMYGTEPFALQFANRHYHERIIPADESVKGLTICLTESIVKRHPEIYKYTTEVYKKKWW